jgi:putative ATPase
VILWGPPGVGKTTLAKLIARITRCEFIPFSAVLSGIKEIKAVMADAEKLHRLGRRTILFIDEIHRFNKAQQDAFLPYVERGDIILIGATTENPSFEVISALLSRSRVYALRLLSVPELVTLLRRALPVVHLEAPEELLEQIAIYANGDARQAYNTLEAAAAASQGTLTEAALENAIERKVLLYDKGGEEHFNLISALHKSVRSSDVDAALYWLARMLESGEDRLYLARRLIRMSIEDIGLADPRALEQAIAAMQAVHFLGIPEGDLALAQLAIYLCAAPKSDASYKALGAVAADVENTIAEPVPMNLRNAVTRHMKAWGYGEGSSMPTNSRTPSRTWSACPRRSPGGVTTFQRTAALKSGSPSGWKRSAGLSRSEARTPCNPYFLPVQPAFTVRSARGAGCQACCVESRLDISCRVTSAAPPAPPLVLTS